MAQQQLKMEETEHRLHGREEVQFSEAAAGMSHQEDEDQQGKRSVVARVKDKARRLKNSLRRKKHEGNEDNGSPARGITLAEEEEEEEEDSPEYHGAPMYESATIPQVLAGTPSPVTPGSSTTASPTTPKEPLVIERPDKTAPIDSKSQHIEFPRKPSELPPAPEPDHSDGRTLAENVKEILTPAYNMMTNATQVIASKIYSNPESNDSTTPTCDELGAKQASDKGVSVKNYLIEKLQPGEDERVLSQVITEAVTPRSAGGGDRSGAGQAVFDAVEKIKGAVSSLVGMADMTDDSPTAKEAVSATTVVSPAKIQADHHSGEEIPVSTIPYSRRSISK